MIIYVPCYDVHMPEPLRFDSVINLKISTDQKERLQQEAIRNEMTMSAYIRWVVMMHLEKVDIAKEMINAGIGM